jgi:glycosyltransferase involved in cell wall biosynthesis
MIWLFWLAVLFLLYTLAGYPLALWVLSRFRNHPHARNAITPSVSIIVAAHNEAGSIANKIRNSLALTYPPDRCEIIVASDGSQDSTAEIVRSFSNRGVRLIEIPERRGKQFAQLQGRNAARGEILVFTDVGVELDSGALQAIVANFGDPKVGCVSSEDEIVKGPGFKGEQSYVSFEMWMRRLESSVGSLVTASGSFFAARRAVCEPWHTDKTSDFFVVLNTVRAGMRSVVDPASIGRYGLSRSDRFELQRKVRTIVNGLDVFFMYVDLLNPLRYRFFSWELVSHKLFRWLVPSAMLLLFVSNFFLWKSGPFYQLCLVGQALIYGAGLLALTVKSFARWKPVKLAGYFLLGSAATLMAWFYFLSGEKFVSWQPTQRG